MYKENLYKKVEDVFLSFIKSMDVNLAILDVELSIIGLFLLVLTVNSSAIAVISPNIHPKKSLCQ